MLKFLRNFFEKVRTPDYATLWKAGAAIIDVRSKAEFRLGHIDESVNIPLDSLKQNLYQLPSDKQAPIIVCCASGIRSSQALTVLKRVGYSQVFNAGSWTSLHKKMYN